MICSKCGKEFNPENVEKLMGSRFEQYRHMEYDKSLCEDCTVDDFDHKVYDVLTKSYKSKES